MSALQSVMSQLVISIRCNCITPAAESDSKKGRRGGNVIGRRAAHCLHAGARAKVIVKQEVHTVPSASTTLPLLILRREIPFATSINNLSPNNEL